MKQYLDWLQIDIPSLKSLIDQDSQIRLESSHISPLLEKKQIKIICQSNVNFGKTQIKDSRYGHLWSPHSCSFQRLHYTQNLVWRSLHAPHLHHGRLEYDSARHRLHERLASRGENQHRKVRSIRKPKLLSQGPRRQVLLVFLLNGMEILKR